jgi:hypothetical protein
MKKKLAIGFVVLLIGAIFFIKDYVNPRPLSKTIWIEKDISKNQFLQPNTSRDTVLVLEVKGEFLQIKSCYYGLIETFSIATFKSKYNRCLECEMTKFEK